MIMMTIMTLAEMIRMTIMKLGEMIRIKIMIVKIETFCVSDVDNSDDDDVQQQHPHLMIFFPVKEVNLTSSLPLESKLARSFCPEYLKNTTTQ
jgi:hypothetical protein